MDETEKSTLYMNICVLKLLKKLNMKEKNMVLESYRERQMKTQFTPLNGVLLYIYLELLSVYVLSR